MDNKEVNWSIFDITPDGDKDVSRKQVVEEFRKFNGTPREFALELERRFEYSGYMCELVERWCEASQKSTTEG